MTIFFCVLALPSRAQNHSGNPCVTFLSDGSFFIKRTNLVVNYIDDSTIDFLMRSSNSKFGAAAGIAGGLLAANAKMRFFDEIMQKNLEIVQTLNLAFVAGILVTKENIITLGSNLFLSARIKFHDEYSHRKFEETMGTSSLWGLIYSERSLTTEKIEAIQSGEVEIVGFQEGGEPAQLIDLQISLEASTCRAKKTADACRPLLKTLYAYAGSESFAKQFSFPSLVAEFELERYLNTLIAIDIRSR